MIRRWMYRIRMFDLIALCAALTVGLIVTAQVGESPQKPNSKFVYPVQSAAVRFDHSRHSDIGCAQCHGAALTSQRAFDRLTPPMKTCAGCHAETEPRLQDCAGCHVGYSVRSEKPVTDAEDWKSVRPAPMIPPRIPSTIRFDHSGHVGRMGGERSCATCHGSAGGSEPTMPTMESCNTCHDGRSAPDSCSTCHPTDSSSGKLRTVSNFASEPLRPDNHSVDFIKRHAMVAKSSSDECMACHVEEDCASCHTASFAKPFAVHPPNFVTMHAIDARTGSGECTDCHSVQTFCTSCHVRADVTTDERHDPPPRRQIHPPSWLEASAPNNHGVMARRDITECASCHSETDCVTCHAGIDPHPPEFALDCGRMLAANPAPCARCHGDIAGLRSLCR